MDNLEQVNKLQKEVNKAAGNSKRKYNEDYAESVEAKVKNLKHAWEELYQSLISSDALKIILQTGTKLVGVLDALIHSSRGTKVSLLVLLPTIILIGKHFKYMIDIIKSGKDLKFIDVLWGSLFGKMTSGVGVVESLKGAFKSLFGTISSFNALITSPTGLMFAGIAVTIGVATAAIVKHIKHQKDLREENKKLKKSYEDLTKAMRENNKEEIKNAIEDPQKAQDELQALMKRRDELKKAMKNTPHMTGMSGENNADLKETEIRIQELQKSIKSSNLTLNETTGKIIDIAKAKNQIVNSDVADAIKETAEYELKEKDYIAGLYDEYNRLSSIKNKSKTEEKELSNVSEKLNDNVKGLILTKDKEGNVIIENTGLLNDEVKMLKTEGMTVEELTKAKLEAAKEHAQIQRGMTKISYEEARKRILFLHEEMRKREPLADAIDKVLPSAKITGMNPVRRQIDMLKDESVELEEQMARLDSIFKQPSSMNISETPDFNPTDPEKLKKSTDALKENTGETDKNREAVNKAKEAVKQYELALKSLEIQMTKNNIALGRLYEHSDSYINKLKEKQNLIKQEIALNKQQIAMNGQLANSLGAVGGDYAGAVGTNIGQQVVTNAMKYIGTPYVWGGKDPSGFDCSGLVQYAFKQAGIQINGDTWSQMKQGTQVSKSNLQVGDAIFFNGGGHVGLYMGNGQYVHAPKRNDVVKVSNLSDRGDFYTARRYISGGNTVSRTTASNYSGKYSSYINEAAAKYGVSAALIAAIIKAESDFNPNDRSGAGAMGLMQLMPETARELGVSNPFDPRQNIMGGTQEIAKYLKKYNGNLDLALAAYNAGMGNVQKYGGIPPFKETKDYIPKVKKFMKEYGGSESSIHSTIDEQMDLIGKSMDMEKKNLELQEELNKINIQILEARLGQFDDKVKSIDRTITQLRTDVDLQNKNDINYINYLSKIDDYTVKKLDVLKKERDFIKKEISSGIYDEKTIKMLGEKYSDIGTVINSL
ncbi:transglycosylase SLT domain-containing protein [Clostridium botulinum]|uniref:transglycosylase SLT domain-containing protein n=1 Tax=Clostridium botulinum TaxID=1491 RepID=UPI0023B9A9CA|nr:transglycosylase SLT domain-containing protein [Clostridium botulinum]